jgi:hypothetical protein
MEARMHMQDETCSHLWQMANVEHGFIITEQCSDTKKIVTYFSLNEPPLEEYRDGEHFWNVMETAQSIRFDLQCSKCKKLEKFNDLMGLMMCTGCIEDCEVFKLMKKLEPERTWVYVAFGFLPADERKQLSKEQLAILENYFNQRRKSSTAKSRIKIVGHELVKNYATCCAEIIRDVYLLSLTPPEVK